MGSPAFEFFLEGLALGYVAGDADHAREVSSGVEERRGGNEHGHDGTILTLEQHLTRPRSSRP